MTRRWSRSSWRVTATCREQGDAAALGGRAVSVQRRGVSSGSGQDVSMHSCGLAPGENDSDDHQHDANRTADRESLDDRAERADVIDDDRGDDLPDDDETDRVA